jgi:hypothetical protein
VEVTDLLGVQLKGWHWGPGDSVQRWGENIVADIINGDGIPPLPGGGGGVVGLLLKLAFEPGATECTLSAGDSGGAVFIQDGAEWRLAGINFAVDGPYSTTNSGPGMLAAIFDEGGLYRSQAGQWVPIPDVPTPQPSNFYATRISSNLAWISTVIGTAPPPDLPALVAASEVTGSYLEIPATVDSVGQTLSTPVPGQTTFYRLRGCGAVRITEIRIQSGALVFSYQ